ncbi:hypothetical protein FKW77_001799 [Venturia effusa]|uniref:Uncharacterized protein n=1 Tax=Venturia effusa TaxID=50376 RepID=A0A517L8P1_9PEZI|nr:hypothetical protein FKW77_001799 [Venturia effusa]
MCYIEKTNYVECASPRQHSGVRQIDPREFEASYPQYQYMAISPGYVPCEAVLQGQLSARGCHDLHNPIQIRLAQPSLCPHCNCIRSEHGHRVLYRAGHVVQVTYFQDPKAREIHQVHLPFIPLCLLCRSGASEMNKEKESGGLPLEHVRFGSGPKGPPGPEAYKSYGWGPDFH